MLWVGLGRYINTYRYALGRYGIDRLGCCIAIHSEILLATNLVISNLKIYIFRYVLFLQCKCSLLKTRSNGQIGKSNDRATTGQLLAVIQMCV